MNRSFLSVLIASLILVAALRVPVTYAHVTGASWETAIGTYTSDIGYDPTYFTAGQYTQFNFALWKGTTTTDSNGITSGTPQPFAQVWVRIVDSDTQSTLLATGIWSQPIGPTTLLYEFQEPGHYKLEASYRDAQGNDIAVASQLITVTSGTGDYGWLLLDAGLLIAGVVLGVAGAILPSKIRNWRRS